MVEPNVETYLPWRLYARTGWAAFAGSLVCIVCGARAPLAFIPALICAGIAGFLLWLAVWPPVRLGETQFNIGDRAVAWREVRQINKPTLACPLVLDLKLTNSRHKWMIYPGDPERIEKLLWVLRKNCFMASFDGVPHREYWAWETTAKAATTAAAAAVEKAPVVVEQQAQPQEQPQQPPSRMVSQDEEDEIERMYQKLKAVGRLDTRLGGGEAKTPDAD